MPRAAIAPRRPARFVVAVLLCACLSAVAGCGLGAPRSIDPAGVDGLEIPTPSPEPADFVDTIDNPYLPLVAGSEWSYESDASAETVTVTVSGEGRQIAGVSTTAVTTVTERPRRTRTSTRYFAQDRDGNVWSFGADDWQAGVSGARAGLVMPATPRVGDGFVQHDAPGVAEDRSEVLDVAATASTAYGAWTEVVQIRETTPLDPAREAVRSYAPGIGLVRAEMRADVLELVAFSAGP